MVIKTWILFISKDDNSILTDSPSYERDAGCNNLYQQFFSADEHDEHALFNELLPEGKLLYTWVSLSGVLVIGTAR